MEIKDFKQWLLLGEALETYIKLAIFLEHDRKILEGRANPEALRQSIASQQKSLFQAPEDEPYYRPPFSCLATPLSSFDKEINAIRQYAQRGPDEFAQVLLFSPLSANVSFAKHWDNFPVMMTILKYAYPNGATPDQLRKAVQAFGTQYSKLSATIQSWKYDTIADVWNRRDLMFDEVKKAAADGSDIKLLAVLSTIPGVAPVKAGFIAQLIFGRSGCIDTHNIDIYSKVWPDMKDELNPDLWGKKGTKGTAAQKKKSLEAIKQYDKTIKKLKKRGIGTKELWDVWVDFVGHMYKRIVEGGRGMFGEEGFDPALNPKDPKYAELMQFINKMKITSAGKKSGGIIPVPTIAGQPSGGGAGATHTIAAKEPVEILKAFHKMEKGEAGPDWAKAVSRIVNPRTGMPFNKIMHKTPAMIRYFGNAIDPATGKVDKDEIVDIIHRRLQDVDKEKARQASLRAQRPAFPGWEPEEDDEEKEFAGSERRPSPFAL